MTTDNGLEGERADAEIVQRKIDARKSVPQKRITGSRVKVYNKLGARLYTSDGVLEAQSEGEILVADLKVENIKKNVVKIGS